MIRPSQRWSRKTLALRTLAALVGAGVVVTVSLSPAVAAPDAGTAVPPAAGVGTDTVKQDDRVTCTQEKDGSFTCNGESDITKQCDDTVEVSDELTNTWVGLLPATIGCAAITALDWTVRALGMSLDQTEVDLIGDKGRNRGEWFKEQYALMRVIATWTIPPIFFIAVIQAIAKGKFDRLLQIALIYLPISMIGSVVAIVFTQQLLDITDDIAAVFRNSVKGDSNTFMYEVARGFSGHGFVPTLDGTGAWFMSIMLGLGLLLASSVVYVVLSLREGSIYVAALFLPFLFAVLIWPAMHSYFKKLLEFLIGMILSLVVITASISVAVAMFTSVAGLESTAAVSLALDGGNASEQQSQLGFLAWVSQCITLIFIFFIMLFAPNLPAKLFASVGYDDTGRHQTTMLNRPDIKRKADWGNRMIGVATQVVDFKNQLASWGPAREAARDMSPYARTSAAIGLAPEVKQYTERQLRVAGFHSSRGSGGSAPPFGTKDYYNEFAHHVAGKWSGSQNLNERYFAAVLLSIGGEALETFEVNQGGQKGAIPGNPEASPFGYQVAIWQRTDHAGNVVRRAEIIMNTFDRNNNPVSVLPHAAVSAVKEQLAMAEMTGAPLAEIAVHMPAPGLSTGNDNLHGPSGVMGKHDPVGPLAGQHGAVAKALAGVKPKRGTRVKLVDDAYGTNVSGWSTALNGYESAPVGRR